VIRVGGSIRICLVCLSYGFSAGPLQAALPAVAAAPALSDRLESIRGQVQSLEEQLTLSLRDKETAKGNLQSLRVLLRLQADEAEMGRQRMGELERTINELEQRKVHLTEKIRIERRQARSSLINIHRSLSETPRSTHLGEREVIEAPRRKVLSNIVSKNLRELEALKIDLEDARTLEQKIAEEKAQLDWLFNDLEERRGILELNRSIQADLLKKRQADRISQLENYRKLKSAEHEVGRLIQNFNARRELERTVDMERRAVQQTLAVTGAVSTQDALLAFEKLQGRLPLPVSGAKLMAGFGRTFDQASGLQIFRKGVDFSVPPSSAVRVVHPGKVAFAGDMPGYGRITIVDHGSHFYSLYGRLGSLAKREGDSLAAGETVGLSDAAGGELYFEIRARNLPVNPMSWVVASNR
jgi:septal ring factor EnvC (AmiA/AmiB activator)